MHATHHVIDPSPSNDARAERGRPPIPAAVGRGILIALGLLAAASLVTVLIAFPDGTPTSADAGAPRVPTWVTLLPALVGVGLALMLPQRRLGPEQPVLIDQPSRLRMTTLVLLALAIAFPLAVGVLRFGAEDYVLAKLAAFIVLPAILVLTVRRSVRIARSPGAWRWWAPAVVVVVWAALAVAAPWVPAGDFASVDPMLLMVAATATAITAGFGEEFFYRRLLQTRLEALGGPWVGIALTSVIFAFMHLASHGTGELWLDIARIVVAQGSFGLFMGVLWWRYRNLTMNVIAHLLVNGYSVVAFFLASGT